MDCDKYPANENPFEYLAKSISLILTCQSTLATSNGFPDFQTNQFNCPFFEPNPNLILKN